jgi:hypothetical protein
LKMGWQENFQLSLHLINLIGEHQNGSSSCNHIGQGVSNSEAAVKLNETTIHTQPSNRAASDLFLYSLHRIFDFHRNNSIIEVI